jgi:hypothetical protein
LRPAPCRSEHEAAQVARANESGKQPVVYVHGLWLLASSWDRRVEVFEDAGYVSVLADWPDDPDSVAEAHEHPEVFASTSIGEIADHVAAAIGTLGASLP